MFMIVMDAHSKWPEVLYMPRITTELTIESLRTIHSPMVKWKYSLTPSSEH
ncbi:hypothetical protein T07_14230, partial [Trichinella nelsoni]